MSRAARSARLGFVAGLALMLSPAVVGGAATAVVIDPAGAATDEWPFCVYVDRPNDDYAIWAHCNPLLIVCLGGLTMCVEF